MNLVRTGGISGEKGNWRQQVLRLAGALLGGLVCLCAQCAPAADESVSSFAPKDWLDKVQTWCMVPVLPETARALHVTVNGVWGGIGGINPLLTHREVASEVEATYGDNTAAFVAACREAGLLVPGIVNGIEGFLTLRAVWPDLDKMACWNAAGKPAQVSEEMLLMCVNNPNWQQWELDWGKRAIDEGADLVMLDTPMSASFISGFLKAGFCPHCLANFQQYLESKYTETELKERFGLETFDPQKVIALLAPLQDLSSPANRPHHNSSKEDLLFREFIYCQEQASFDTRKKLLSELREYAAAQGRQVAFATNASDLGTVNPGGHWVRALMFADLVDLFVYEQNPEPEGMMSNQAMKYPRGKGVAYHKLAQAIHHRRAPAVIHASQMGTVLVDVLTKGVATNSWFEAQSAEAYATNGAYVQYYVSPDNVKRLFLEKCWSGSAEHARFVLSHRDLYEGELRSGSSLGVLFLYNERGRTIPGVYPSYLGFAQGLAEGNYPFDVVFAGDGHYVQDRLTASDLAPYRVLLVPSPIAPTPGQQQVVRDYVTSGGTVVCQEPEALGLSAALEAQDADMPTRSDEPQSELQSRKDSS